MDDDDLFRQFGPERPRSKATFEEKMAELDSIPLFMKSLPEESTDDPMIAALQKVAENFKDQGNDYFKGRRYREAQGFYTQGIDAKPTDPVLHEALLCNRAAANLELSKCWAITLNARSSKAYYRSALALVALDRAEEAIDCCDRCLQFDSENKGVQSVRAQTQSKKDAKEKKEREKQERLRKEQEARYKMLAAFKERNLIVLKKKDDLDNPYEPHFDPEDPTGTSLIIPVFFLYPQYATSDIIPEFVEDTPFSSHLAVMFPPQAPPPAWDTKHEYVDGKLAVYAMTRRKRLLKVGKKMSLREVCTAAKEKEGELKDGLELKDGCLTFVVLPKGDAEKKWIDEYKATRDS
ncbi:unnamed protein product [Mycena citricolor]|uniref:Cns1/TTC4 wheel domain-containing protein n=1 Tax=Mycena citricolor TaxID=2018698 RepID=A0AAD2GUM8_9AGAR|nr:unnamed protein product [Mycena citricolor]